MSRPHLDRLVGARARDTRLLVATRRGVVRCPRGRRTADSRRGRRAARRTGRLNGPRGAGAAGAPVALGRARAHAAGPPPGRRPGRRCPDAGTRGPLGRRCRHHDERVESAAAARAVLAARRPGARRRARRRRRRPRNRDRARAFVEDLRRRSLDAGLSDRVCFAGPLYGADLDRAYAAADLLVLASRGEAYGMVVIEALARGLPVVAADVGGLTEALGHGADGIRPGLLVPPDDPAALGAALRAWLGDAELRGRLRRAACERRESLSGWSTTTSVIAGVLAGVSR